MHGVKLFAESMRRIPQNVVIVGGSRGIGLGFVEKYLKRGDKVWTTYRDNGRWDGLRALQNTYPTTLTLSELEVTNSAAVEHWATQFSDVSIDVLILNSGIILCKPGANSLTETVDDMRQTMEVNTYAPDHIMRILFGSLLHSNSCAVYISSTLASFAHNLKGRYHSYRASKAAGNMVMQTWNAMLAAQWLEQGHALDDIPCAFPISPGVVQTDMGGASAELTVDESVTGMIEVIDGVKISKQCSFYLYNNHILETYPDVLVVKNKREEMSLKITG